MLLFIDLNQASLKENEKQRIIYHTVFQNQITDGLHKAENYSNSWLQYLTRDIVTGQHRVTRMVASSLMSSILSLNDSYLKKSMEDFDRSQLPISKILRENAIEVGILFN